MGAVQPLMSVKRPKRAVAEINWAISDEDDMVIRRIVDRAITEFADMKLDRMDLQMDLIATHANGCPLRLRDLLHADAANFGHDVFGIRRYIDRETGKMTQCFLPRFYDSATKAVSRG